MPKTVSVLLPCFDAAATVTEALESLLCQSFDDFEVVAVDDGSSDGTYELLVEASRLDRRVKVFHRRHSGIAPTLAFAASRSESPLLARMDADDRAHPERLRLQTDFLATHPDAAVVASQVRLFPRDQLTDGARRYEAWVNSLVTHDAILRDLFVESPLPHPSVVMRRAAFAAAGGYRDNGWPEDYDLWMRLSLQGKRLEKIPETLLEWRDTPERATRVDPNFCLTRFAALKEHYLFATHLGNDRPVAVWGAGAIGKSWARRLRARGRSVSYFVDVDPRKIGQRVYGAPVLSMQELDRLRGHLILVAVAGLSRKRDDARPYYAARDEIREYLARARFVELEDYLCIA